MMNSNEFEIVLLGTLFYKPQLLDELLIPDYIIEDKTNLFILNSFRELYKESKTIDIPSLQLKMTNLDQHQKIAFTDRIGEIVSLTEEYDVRNFDYYQEQLFKNYKDKMLKKLINDYDKNKVTSDELYSNIHKLEEFNIFKKDGIKTEDEILNIVTANNKRINFRKFYRLSKSLNFKEHDLLVISARTGVGKSGFMLNLVEQVSNKYKCLLFNMEMSETSLFKRLISINSGVLMNEITKENIYVCESAKDFSKRNLKVYTSGQTIQSIRRTIIEESREEHTIVFIDYIGLVGNQNKYKSLYELVTANVKELRSISMTYNCTIVMLAQINRSGDENPSLTDLKESGEIEQSATQVIILSGQEKNMNDENQEITLTIAKNRDGRCCRGKYIYHKNNQRFEEETND